MNWNHSHLTAEWFARETALSGRVIRKTCLIYCRQLVPFEAKEWTDAISLLQPPTGLKSGLVQNQHRVCLRISDSAKLVWQLAAAKLLLGLSLMLTPPLIWPCSELDWTKKKNICCFSPWMDSPTQSRGSQEPALAQGTGWQPTVRLTAGSRSAAVGSR